MDEIDRAQKEIDNQIEYACYQTRQQLKTDRLTPKDSCHYCDKPFEEDSIKLFCNGKCADKHHIKHNGVHRR